MSIIIPQKRQNPVIGLLPVAGTVVGSIYGGPAGGAAGGAIGGAVAGSQQGKDVPTIAYEPKPQDSGPMARSLQATENDPHEQLVSAYRAMDKMPKDFQDQYRQPLSDALRMSFDERERGYA